MTQELSFCPRCKQEIYYTYDRFDQVIAQTRCKCYKPSPKVLDKAMRELKKEMFYAKKSYRRTDKVSTTSADNSKKQD